MQLVDEFVLESLFGIAGVLHAGGDYIVLGVGHVLVLLFLNAVELVDGLLSLLLLGHQSSHLLLLLSIVLLDLQFVRVKSLVQEIIPVFVLLGYYVLEIVLVGLLLLLEILLVFDSQSRELIGRRGGDGGDVSLFHVCGMVVGRELPDRGLVESVDRVDPILHRHFGLQT